MRNLFDLTEQPFDLLCTLICAVCLGVQFSVLGNLDLLAGTGVAILTVCISLLFRTQMKADIYILYIAASFIMMIAPVVLIIVTIAEGSGVKYYSMIIASIAVMSIAGPSAIRSETLFLKKIFLFIGLLLMILSLLMERLLGVVV